MKERIWIFIGYSMLDEGKVEDIYHRLSAEGFRPWAIGRDLLPGDNPLDRTRVAIRSADFFLACLSHNSVDEQGNPEPKFNEQLSLQLHTTQTKAFLIPVRLEECPIPGALESLMHVDLFKDDGWQILLESLNTVIKRRKEIDVAWNDLISELDASAIDVVKAVEFASMEDAEGQLDGPSDKYSSRAWEIDLRKLIRGQRAASLLRLGGVEEYIEMNLEESDDLDVAKQAFDDALEKLVATWPPSVLDDGYDVTLLLDLIRIFTPPGGFVKVAEFTRRLKQFEDTSSHEDMIAGDSDILRGALGALEGYYRIAPKSPEDSSPAYVTYIELLIEELWNPQNSGYALKRLIELKVIEHNSDETKRLIEKNPAVLRELVKFLLDPNRSSAAEENLTEVFIYCLYRGDKLVSEFERAVMHSGGAVDYSNEESPALFIIYSGRELRLSLSEEDLQKYQQIRWKRTDRAGFSKIEELANVSMQ